MLIHPLVLYISNHLYSRCKPKLFKYEKKAIYPKACYAALTITNATDATLQASLKVEFVMVDYDVEMAAKAVENSPLPNALHLCCVLLCHTYIC
jgi:hypothetical protein